MLWFILFTYSIKKITNPYHHLAWMDYVIGPQGSNYIYFNHAILSDILNSLLIAVAAYAIVLMALHGFRSSGWEKFFAFSTMAAFLLPFSCCLLNYVTNPNNVIVAYPFGFTLSSQATSFQTYSRGKFQLT